MVQKKGQYGLLGAAAAVTKRLAVGRRGRTDTYGLIFTLRFRLSCTKQPRSRRDCLWFTDFGDRKPRP